MTWHAYNNYQQRAMVIVMEHKTYCLSKLLWGCSNWHLHHWYMLSLCRTIHIKQRTLSTTQQWCPYCFMNLKNSNNNMTCFPFFIDVVYNQRKNIKSSSKVAQIKNGNNCGCFNKDKKHILFHGLNNHVWENLMNELSWARNTTWPHKWRTSLLN